MTLNFVAAQQLIASLCLALVATSVAVSAAVGPVSQLI
jgi:hypothetical protein